MADAEYLKSLIGTTTHESTVVVERGPLTVFAEAVLDRDPIYRNADAAAAAGFDGIPAPPTYPFVMQHWGRFEELQGPSEGHLDVVSGILGVLLKEGGLILHGEQSFHHHRPIVAGDVLEGKGSVVDAYAKESNGKTMTFIVEETVWRDQASGEPVSSTRFNVIHRI
jgi:acyl dehydratase